MAEKRPIIGWITIQGRHVPLYEKKEIIFSEYGSNPHSDTSRKHAQIVDTLPYSMDRKHYLGESQEGYDVYRASVNPGQFGYVATKEKQPIWTQEREDLGWKAINYAKVHGKSVKWDQLYSDMNELITDMVNTASDPTLPLHKIVKGYEYINSFKKVIEKGGNLSEAQERQLKRLASSIFENVHPQKSTYNGH